MLGYLCHRDGTHQVGALPGFGALGGAWGSAGGVEVRGWAGAYIAGMPGPAYIIRTERLLLRCKSPADAPALKAAIDRNLDHLRPWMPWAMNEPSEVGEIVDRIRRFRAAFDRDEDYALGIFDPTGERVLGGTGMHLHDEGRTFEIGYWMDKDHTGRGLTTEAVAAQCRLAFEVHGVRRVEIRCDPENTPSARIPEKLGFKREGVLRQQDRSPAGEPRDTVVWALVPDDLPGSPVSETEVEAWDATGERLI